MAESHSTATPEATKATSTAQPPVQDVQMDAESDRNGVMGDRMVRAIGGGSPQKPPSQFAGALGQLGSSSQVGMLRGLQRSYGNSYVGRVIQAKLTVGQPGDVYEQEADRVADTVMRMSEPTVSGVLSHSNAIQPMPIQRMCTECAEEEEEKIHPKESAGQTPTVTPALEARLDGTRGGGEPLPESVRSFMEPRFGTDFSQVQVHTGSNAVQMNRELGAQAFTRQRDIYFGAGRYSPDTRDGQRLLAHELTHVVQQGSGIQLAHELTHFIQQRKYGSNAIQRRLVTAESVYPQISHDSIYETLAHEMAYAHPLNEEQEGRLARLGFEPREIFEGEPDFQMIGFMPTNDRAGRRRFPVLAFRGSEFSFEHLRDWIDDLNPEGVGFAQFRNNLDDIEAEIDSMGGRVDVTGHSLGGTLAQLVAVAFPTKVRRAVTFQAPGLPQRWIDSLVLARVRAREEGREDEIVRSTHYRSVADGADMGGYGFTPGTVYEVPDDILSSSGEAELLAVEGAVAGARRGWVGAVAGAGGGYVRGSVTEAIEGHTAYILYRLNRMRREDPERFRQLMIEVHPTAVGADARGTRLGEDFRYLLGLALHSTLEYSASDERIRDRIQRDPEYLRSRTYEQKVQLIRTLAEGVLEREDADAIASIIRTMSRDERQRFCNESFEEIIPLSAVAARHAIASACEYGELPQEALARIREEYRTLLEVSPEDREVLLRQRQEFERSAALVPQPDSPDYDRTLHGGLAAQRLAWARAIDVRLRLVDELRSLEGVLASGDSRSRQRLPTNIRRLENQISFFIREGPPQLLPSRLDRRAQIDRAYQYGVRHGQAYALEHGDGGGRFTSIGFVNPFAHIGRYEQGFDDVMRRDDIYFILEYKGQNSPYSPGQMEPAWILRNIQRLAAVGGQHETLAHQLLTAWREGRLRGVAYRSRFGERTRIDRTWTYTPSQLQALER